MKRPGSTPQGLGSAPPPMSLPGGPLHPTRLRMGTFDDRVMASVALEPTPTAARVFVRSLLTLRWRDAAATLATAWHLAFGASRSMPSFVRAQALALLVVTTLVVGTGGTFAAAGALRVLEGPSEPPVIDLPVLVAEPTPRLLPNLPSPSPSPDPDRAGAQQKSTKQQSDASRRKASDDADKRGSGSGTKTQSQESSKKRQQDASTKQESTKQQDGSRQQRSDDADKRESGSGTKTQSQESSKSGGATTSGIGSSTKDSDQDSKGGSN